MSIKDLIIDTKELLYNWLPFIIILIMTASLSNYFDRKEPITPQTTNDNYYKLELGDTTIFLIDNLTGKTVADLSKDSLLNQIIDDDNR